MGWGTEARSVPGEVPERPEDAVSLEELGALEGKVGALKLNLGEGEGVAESNVGLLVASEVSRRGALIVELEVALAGEWERICASSASREEVVGGDGGIATEGSAVGVEGKCESDDAVA